MYKILRRGNALTLVIAMIMVMTLIGVPLLSLVVYNFYMREFDLAIKRAEYKNEMLMDRVYIATQSCVINAISEAKKEAITNVDAEVETQKNLYWEYEEMHKQFEDEIKNDPTYDALNEEEIETEVQIRLNAYYTDEYKDEPEFDIQKAISIIDIETGKIKPIALQEAYNSQFKKSYKATIINTEEDPDSLYAFTNEGDNYSGIITGITEDTFSNKPSYSPENLTNDGSGHINVHAADVDGTLIAKVATLYKAERAPTVMLSADFIIGTPEFNQISAMEQKTVELSNPLLYKTLVADDNLVIGAGKLTVDGDVIINGNSIEEETEKGIIINGGLDVSGILATAKDINIDGAGGNLTTGTNSLHYNNMYVNGAGSTAGIGGDIYAQDDLEISTDDFEVMQDATKHYYGFEDNSEEMNPDSSSSIIINTNTPLPGSKLELGKLYLAGRAFMKDVKSTEPGDAYYKTGESISIKGNNVAYQTPLPSGDYVYTNMKFGQYLYNMLNPISLVENFIGEDDETFDVAHKWKYFIAYANQYALNIVKPDIKIASIEYMQGAGIGKVSTDLLEPDVIKVIESKTTGGGAFRTNSANQYIKQTTYYGYHVGTARDLFGQIDTSWLLTNVITGKDISASRIRMYDGNLSMAELDLLELDGSPKYDVIICTGDLTITASADIANPTKLSGLIIAGGDISVTGYLNITNNKSALINMILEGADTDNVGQAGYADKESLYDMFAYDGSGTTYVITKAGDNFININELIGITNWKKWDRGFF